MKYKAVGLLNDFNYLGEKHLDNGTVLIGKAPHIAPLAWLHTIYAVLNEEEIGLLEKKLGCVIPFIYKNFLQTTNGLNVFNGTLSLFGFRKNYNRTVDNILGQPFDIIVPNVLERPYNAKGNVFIIGSYNWDGSYLYIDTKTNKVHLCERNDATSLLQWPDFETMIEREIPRLISLFDKEGKEIDEAKSTLPI